MSPCPRQGPATDGCLPGGDSPAACPLPSPFPGSGEKESVNRRCLNFYLGDYQAQPIPLCARTQGHRWLWLCWWHRWHRAPHHPRPLGPTASPGPQPGPGHGGPRDSGKLGEEHPAARVLLVPGQ